MPSRIEDYALIGDTQTAALVGRDGSIDWLCLPRFDSRRVLRRAARRRLDTAAGCSRRPPRCAAPRAATARTRSSSRPTSRPTTACVRVVDFMPIRDQAPDVVRIVAGRRGPRRDADGARPPLRLRPRRAVGPRTGDGAADARSPGRTRSHFVTPVPPDDGEDLTTVARVRAVSAGERVPFVLTWYPSHEPEPDRRRRGTRRSRTPTRWWRDWSGALHATTATAATACMRSLITLKALTYAPTGGIVAAPTTSLPEEIGGVRNWDYRFCWLRDATFTLCAAASPATPRRPRAWRDWLLRAVAGDAGRAADHVRRWPASGGCPRSRSTGCPATRAPRRCGSATPPRTSSSSTSTAR